MLGLCRWVWWVLSSEALFTAKNVMTISFGNSFTKAPDSPLPDRMFILGKFDVKNVFSSRVRLETTKGGFPLSCCLYVRTQVNFTPVNNIEPMYGRSRVNVKFELRSTLFKRAVSRQSSSFCLILPITRPQSLWNLGTIYMKVGGPQVGQVTCVKLPHLACKRDHIKMRDYLDRRVTPPKRVTSPTWGPPPPCKQAIKVSKEITCKWQNQRSETNK